jgi:putative DNA primase/helicase
MSIQTKSEIELEATKVWVKSTKASEHHGYLKAKGVGPGIARQDQQNRIVLPLFDFGRHLGGIQFVDVNGQKRFLPGSHKKGNFIPASEFPKDNQDILICEGWATAQTLQEAFPEKAAIAAIDSGNLLSVVQSARERWPKSEIIVCADNDHANQTNTGLKKATEAASAIGCKLAVPDFSGRPGSDFNDLMLLDGARALVDCITSADKPVRPREKSVRLIGGSEISPRPVEWIWRDWLAAGKTHIMAGIAGTSKTTLAMKIAATITTGGTFPDGQNALSGSVLILTLEDDPNDTLAPRLIAAGADMTKVHFVQALLDHSTGEEYYFDPSEHLEYLQSAIVGLSDVRLLIVDPIVSVVASDSHKNTEVRRSLQALVDLAQETRCAVLGITHLSKGSNGSSPVERVSGSIAFGAVVRLVMFVAKREEELADDAPERVVCRVKSNLGPDDGGFSYCVEQVPVENHPGIEASVIKWGDRLEGSARDILKLVEASSETGRAPTQKQSAKDFLFDLLRDGPLPQFLVEDEAKQQGISIATLRRAKKEMSIKVRKIGGRYGVEKQGWTWELPDQEGINSLLASGQSTEGIQDVHPMRNGARLRAKKFFEVIWFSSGCPLSDSGFPMVDADQVVDFCASNRIDDSRADLSFRCLIYFDLLEERDRLWVVVDQAYASNLLLRSTETNSDKVISTSSGEHLEHLQSEISGD